MNKEELNKIYQLLDTMVDKLKKELISGAEYKPSYTPGSFWDRLKRFWSNAIIGSNDTQNNPYAYKNKFGALGEKSPVEEKKENKIISLQQYRFLKEQYDLLECQIITLNENLDLNTDNIKNLKLFRIIDNWTSVFKKEIEKLFTNSEPEASVAAPTPPAAVQAKDDASASSNLSPMPGNPRRTQNLSAAVEDEAEAEPPTSAKPPPQDEDADVIRHLKSVRNSGKKLAEIWNEEKGWIGLGYVIEENNWVLSDAVANPDKKDKKLQNYVRFNKVKNIIDDTYDEGDMLSVLQDLHEKLKILGEDNKQKLRYMNFESWLSLFKDKLLGKIKDSYISGLGQLDDYGS
jgi:hypothetical protein